MILKGNRNLAQVAWNFVNDSLRTTICLQFKPQLIASAAIYLASKFLKYQLPEGKKPWWEVFDARITDLEGFLFFCLISTEISNQILDLYEIPPNVGVSSSNPSIGESNGNSSNISMSSLDSNAFPQVGAPSIESPPSSLHSSSNANPKLTNSNGFSISKFDLNFLRENI